MKFNKKELLALAVFAALILCFCALVAGISDKGDEKEIELVREAVKNAALTCYSVEGVYPEDTEYLRKNYGLTYNEDRFAVFYDAFASNLLPTIQVVERGKDTP